MGDVAQGRGSDSPSTAAWQCPGTAGAGMCSGTTPSEGGMGFGEWGWAAALTLGRAQPPRNTHAKSP